METIEIFTMALGLTEPWYVEDVQFVDNGDNGRTLYIDITFQKGWQFATPQGGRQTAHDTVEREWRHLNFFQHECHIRCRVPRIKTGEHTIETVQVPWARKGSGFTMLFEAYAMLLIEKEMPVSSAAETVGETAPRLWRVFDYWVSRSIERLDLSKVKRVGMDETSYKKGHRYITQFVDLYAHRTIFVTEGRGAEVVSAFVEFLKAHGGTPQQIELVSMDMSAAYVSGCKDKLPHADIVFDRFHVVKGCNEAMEEVRKSAKGAHPFSAYERYTLLSRTGHLDASRHFALADITESCAEIGQAYLLKEAFADLYDVRQPALAEGYLAYWCDMAEDSGLVPFRKFVGTVKSHWDGIVAFFRHGRQTNGLLEGINSKIQLARRRARGFCNLDNLIHMIYLVAGRLNLSYPL